MMCAPGEKRCFHRLIGECGKLILLMCIVVYGGAFASWQENVRPKLFVTLGADDYQKFQGNDTATDFFQEVLRDGNSILIGARNVVYNLSVVDLKEQRKIVWLPNEDDVKMCNIKGKDEVACENYIRIILLEKPDRLLICGTHAYRPRCQYHALNSENYTFISEIHGTVICPHARETNSTAIFSDGELYTGTAADFSGANPIIFNHNRMLQTEQYDSISLNDPDFVGSLSHEDFVYFFFRETAVEYINCGKAIFSRVARVCKKDQGGPKHYMHRWTTFVKARLNCSMPGEFPFYFDEIQSVSKMIKAKHGSTVSQLIYGVFTTSLNSIPGSAVCAFTFQDITDAFEGNYKGNKDSKSNWLPVPFSEVPDPPPAYCRGDSTTMSEKSLTFSKQHKLMDESVPAYFGQPILVRSATPYRFTKIAVDPQIKTPGGKTYDVIFVGTDHGKILKTVNAQSADSSKNVTTVVIEEIDLFTSFEVIRNLEVVRTTQIDQSGGIDDGKLVIVTDNQVVAIKLHRCNSDKISSCSECVAMQDPYCAWDKLAGKCRAHGAPRWHEENVFYQSVATGQHVLCPSGRVMSKDVKVGEQKGYRNELDVLDSMNRPSKDQPSKEVINIMQDKNFDGSGPHISADVHNAQYSLETLVMAILAGVVFALLVGFVAGYFCGRRCHKDEDDNLPYPDTEYEYFEQRQNYNRTIQAEPKLLPQVEEVTYAEPVLLPQASSQNKIQHSPKSTLRKPIGHHHGANSETAFQFQPDGYNTRDTYRGRDNFGTLRSHQGDNYRRGDGFSTTRSVKKVYL